MTTTDTNTVQREVNNFIYNIVPFGSSDLYRAIKVSLEIGECNEWLINHIEDFNFFVGREKSDFTDLDIVAIAYDSILQTARQEIEDFTGFDFINDGAEIYTASNYIATSYDWSDGANDKIFEVLKDNNVQFEDLSDKTQWFLNNIK